MDAREFMEKNFGRLTFGRALRADRLAIELTQPQLAEKVGLTAAAISRFEKGKDFPTANTTALIAEALEMDYQTYFVLIVQDMAEKKGFSGIKVSLVKPKAKEEMQNTEQVRPAKTKKSA